MLTGAMSALWVHSTRAMSDFQRIRIGTFLLALLLSIGSAIGVVFFLNIPPQSTNSDAVQISTRHLRSDRADLVSEIKRELGFDTPKLSTKRADRAGGADDTIAASNVPDRTAAALPSAGQDRSEPSRPGGTVRPAGQAETVETAEPHLRTTVLPDIEQPTSVPAGGAGPETSTNSIIRRRPPAPCRSDTCRRALAECTQLCDAAMSMAVAACPRVSRGATPQEETTCLAKKDRSRRNCHSGCALRNSQEVKSD